MVKHLISPQLKIMYHLYYSA